MLFSKTIDDGQRVAVWSNNGKVTIVDGPKRIGTFMKRIEHLRKHYADHAAYLEVTRKDGSVEIMPGPDFPTGGIIVGRSGIAQAAVHGRGRIRVRGRVTQETIGRREALVINEIPYQVVQNNIIEKTNRATN